MLTLRLHTHHQHLTSMQIFSGWDLKLHMLSCQGGGACDVDDRVISWYLWHPSTQSVVYSTVWSVVAHCHCEAIQTLRAWCWTVHAVVDDDLKLPLNKTSMIKQVCNELQVVKLLKAIVTFKQCYDRIKYIKKTVKKAILKAI